MGELWVAVVAAGATLSGVAITAWFNRKDREEQRQHDKELQEQAWEHTRAKERRQQIRDLYAQCLALMREFEGVHHKILSLSEEVEEWHRDDQQELYYESPYDGGSAIINEHATRLLDIDARFEAILGGVASRC